MGDLHIGGVDGMEVYVEVYCVTVSSVVGHGMKRRGELMMGRREVGSIAKLIAL